MVRTVRWGFNIHTLLRQGDLDIRRMAEKNEALSAKEYFGTLSRFLRALPDFISALSLTANSTGNEATRQCIEEARDILIRIGNDKLGPDIDGLLSALEKGDKMLAAYCATKLMPKFNGLLIRMEAAQKDSASPGSPEDSEGREDNAYESLKLMLAQIDYDEKNRKPRVLAVDDNTFMLKTITHALNNDYEVLTLTKPALLCNFLRQSTPDLFLLDYTMPEINGFDLVPMIRDFDEHKDTPIIFLTATGTPQHVVTAVSLGASDFVVKPVKPDILREKIAKHIIKKRAY